MLYNVLQALKLYKTDNYRGNIRMLSTLKLRPDRLELLILNVSVFDLFDDGALDL